MICQQAENIKDVWKYARIRGGGYEECMTYLAERPEETTQNPNDEL